MFNGNVDPDMYQGPGMDLSFMDKFEPRQHNPGKSGYGNMRFNGGDIQPKIQSRLGMLRGLMGSGLGDLFGGGGKAHLYDPQSQPQQVQPQSDPVQRGPFTSMPSGPMPNFESKLQPRLPRGQMPAMPGYTPPQLRPMPPSNPSPFPQQMPQFGPPPSNDTDKKWIMPVGMPSQPMPQFGPPNQAPMQLPQMGMPDMSWMDRFRPQQQPGLPPWFFNLFNPQPQMPQQMPQWGQMFNWF